MTPEYLEALKKLQKQWSWYVYFHAYAHDGEEHDHSLEEDAVETEKAIIRTFVEYGVERIGSYSKEAMLKEVEKQRAIPPRQYVDTVHALWDSTPHHPVLRALELAIAEAESCLEFERSRAKGKQTTKEISYEKTLRRWDPDEYVGFVVGGNRVEFIHGEKRRDLRLKNESSDNHLISLHVPHFCV